MDSSEDEYYVPLFLNISLYNINMVYLKWVYQSKHIPQ
jgi:hypothetical protein